MDGVEGPGLVSLGLVGPGLAPLRVDPGAAPPADPAAEPAGYLVVADGGTRIHFLDWGGRAGGLAGGLALGVAGGRAGGLAGDPVGDRPAPAPVLDVLLVHGLGNTAWSWAPVARRLRSVARVVAMDVRGHGLSDAATGGYDSDVLVADALAVAEGGGLLAGPGEPPRRLVVAGHGFGAMVAGWTARALGERCAGLVLVDGGWEAMAEETDLAPDEWLRAIEEPPEVMRSMTAWLADRVEFDPASWDADQDRAARAQVVETAAGRVKPAVHPHALAGSVGAMFAHQPLGVLSAVEAAVVALVARDEPDGRRAAALRKAAAVRAAAGRSPIRAAAFPGLGHNLPRYRPAVVAAAILAAATGGE